MLNIYHIPIYSTSLPLICQTMHYNITFIFLKQVEFSYRSSSSTLQLSKTRYALLMCRGPRNPAIKLYYEFPNNASYQQHFSQSS